MHVTRHRSASPTSALPLTLLIAGSLGAAPCSDTPEEDPPNVIFITVDTLRADRTTPYGYERDTSPTLDRLASQGIRFNRHLSQSSWTKSSMASMWTGFYPTRTGVTRYDHVVPEQAVMPAERLKEAGYSTIGLYRNGWVAPTFGFEQGFGFQPAWAGPAGQIHAVEGGFACGVVGHGGAPIGPSGLRRRYPRS